MASKCYIAFSRLFSRFCLRRDSNIKGRLIRQILAKIIKNYSDFGSRLILRSSYIFRYTILTMENYNTIIKKDVLNKAQYADDIFLMSDAT